jgi:NADH-quinone oxidoreductase subunit D
MATQYELEMIDSAARAQQAFEEELHGEKLIINMGPQHPSTHGVFRMVLELDGEEITNCWPEIGYLHRGDEKIAENMTYTQFIPYTDRLDYLAPLANNVAYAYAVEKLCGIDVPPRCQYIRVICAELARISSHLLGIGAMAMDVGAMTVFLYTFRERERIYDLCELICGARFTTSYTRVGGLANDMPAEFPAMCRKFLDGLPATIDETDRLLTRNKIFIERNKDIGVLSRDNAINYGATGPILRGSGVEFDIRKARPYGGYGNFQFDIPTGTVGDCMDRYLVRMEEMRQSIRIILQALNNLPGGEWNAPEAKIVLPEKKAVLTKMEELIHHFINVTEGINAPPGEVYFSAENPKGELGFYIVSRGGGTPHRLKIRAPSFVNLQLVSLLCKGHMMSDTVAILGSLDFVMGECDR